MYHYTQADLNPKSLAQLKAVYAQIGCTVEVTDKRVKANWVAAILTHQSAQVEKVAVAEVTVEEQAKICTTCPLFKPFNDGTGRGLCCGSDQVAREHHPQTQDCLHLIDEQAIEPTVQTPVAQSGTLTFKPAPSANPNKTVYEVFRGADSIGIVAKNEDSIWCSSGDSGNYSTPYEAAAALLPTNPTPTTTNVVIPEIEIDSDVDPDFGTLYRVWNSYHLLGTFHRAANGEWIAYPHSSNDKLRCATAAEAQLLIVAVAGLLVAVCAYDSAVDDLLDKPIDELTVADWQLIKQQAMQSELVAI